MKAYRRTLQFVLICATLELFKEAKITIEHTLGEGLFGEIHKDHQLTEEDVKAIKVKMLEIIKKDIKINKVSVTRKKAIEIFEMYKMEDKVKLLKTISYENLKLYELNGRYDYFYGDMEPSTGVLKVFDLFKYESGFILNYPSEKEPDKLIEFKEQKKLYEIFHETEKWGNILGASDVGSLNEKVINGDIINIIRVAEALHEKKIAYIADMIKEKKDIKVVLIAGPSSSGKTTFSKRLGVQLRVNGFIPVPISLDDYFLNRKDTPKDENGNCDFESIYALDLKLFNENLKDLMNGKKVVLPRFNFKNGEREWCQEATSLPEKSIIIIEGIHGLNELLTSSIPKDKKFKIYISALTQLNLDNHNRIATTDVRIIRRIVRDYLSRGYGGEETLKMWDSVRKGEEKNIFVFQEEADAMFNSTLVYELCALKKYAIIELDKIKEDSPVYDEGVRLKSFLNFFKEIDVEYVPENSILREFVGGSCFYKY
ncbi:uridine kinase [Clostridium acidisoli DSM 12555]|uniref:Uridine kinase n=1 Tax=Clostridium acidisoli DSM 12555 TaxID=1121291 RepID=A0A1W1XIH7_9CLOT|nr:nucleoside kinase [Clostridium acidisoli]SMC23785.1 uridine kinase [Clostridium acidisoli DSM 12555]